MSEFEVTRDGVTVRGSDAGEGPAVVLAHGLTATRRYVVMGSSALQRGGHRVLAFDARGHGTSSPAATPEGYGYEELGADLEAVLDHAGLQRAVLAGASMGAHTLAWLALHRWIQGYAYRVAISWWAFVVAGIAALLIALGTVSFLTIRAARNNPVNSLRAE